MMEITKFFDKKNEIWAASPLMEMIQRDRDQLGQIYSECYKHGCSLLNLWSQQTV